MTETMTSTFTWEKQNRYSWRGTIGNIAYWVILTLDHKKFILQLPGVFSPENKLVNREFTSFEDAVTEAERAYLE